MPPGTVVTVPEPLVTPPVVPLVIPPVDQDVVGEVLPFVVEPAVESPPLFELPPPPLQPSAIIAGMAAVIQSLRMVSPSLLFDKRPDRIELPTRCA
jgi:hypothetical protein